MLLLLGGEVLGGIFLGSVPSLVIDQKILEDEKDGYLAEVDWKNDGGISYNTIYSCKKK